jgi:RimJ/RimL family protein N-acetyltransferase
MTDVRVQSLGLEDGPAYNDFFAEGAARHPDTLRISPADVRTAPFRPEHGANGATLVARDASNSWLGVVTVERELGREKRRHIAWVLRMYVEERHSGKGVGSALLSAAIEHARQLPGVAKVNLTVAEHNARAVRLYESAGFRVFAREVDAFRDAEPRTELTMSLRL